MDDPRLDGIAKMRRTPEANTAARIRDLENEVRRLRQRRAYIRGIDGGPPPPPPSPPPFDEPPAPVLDVGASPPVLWVWVISAWHPWTADW